jgi:hypothetical protein
VYEPLDLNIEFTGHDPLDGFDPDYVSAVDFSGFRTVGSVLQKLTQNLSIRVCAVGICALTKESTVQGWRKRILKLIKCRRYFVRNPKAHSSANWRKFLDSDVRSPAIPPREKAKPRNRKKKTAPPKKYSRAATTKSDQKGKKRKCPETRAVEMQLNAAAQLVLEQMEERKKLEVRLEESQKQRGVLEMELGKRVSFVPTL